MTRRRRNPRGRGRRGAFHAAVDRDVVDARLGMPRDLNGNGVDGNDHAADYRILPVVVRFAWRGPGGPSRAEFRTILGDIR